MSCRAELEKGGKWQAIEPAESAWCLHDAEEDEHGELMKSLMITLARPAVTESEVQWKKGQCTRRSWTLVPLMGETPQLHAVQSVQWCPCGH